MMLKFCTRRHPPRPKSVEELVKYVEVKSAKTNSKKLYQSVFNKIMCAFKIKRAKIMYVIN